MSKKMNAGEASRIVLQVAELLKSAPYPVLQAVISHVELKILDCKKPNPKVKAVQP